MKKIQIRKIVFVEPRGSKDNVFSNQMSLPLMGPIYLGTILKAMGHDVTVYSENILKRDITLAELCCDVLCVSILTTSARRGYEIADIYKSANPSGIVVIGGIHATFMPEEAALHADIVFGGEGEEKIAELIMNIESHLNTKMSSDLIAIEHTPIPDFGILKNHEKMKITPVITSRGCPFGCNFCSVTRMFGRGYRAHCTERVISELRNVRTKDVFFYDDNFTADPRRTESIVDAMIKEKINLRWSAQTRIDIAKHQPLIKKMCKAGCERFYIGFESINQKTLDSLHKSQTVESIRESIKIIHKHDIKIHGMFMFGSDEDEKGIFAKTTEFCEKHDLDSVQYLALTPLPGTQTFKEMDEGGRLLHKIWDYYDGVHVVHRPKKMSAEELQDGIIDSFSDFYSYTRAFNDALNISWESAYKFGQKFLRAKLPDVRNVRSLQQSVVRIGGRAIVKRWLRLNKDYLIYLKGIED
jgi:anaerobic magnesium-protoporphyrin IX monomethyl ester cyclase